MSEFEKTVSAAISADWRFDYAGCGIWQQAIGRVGPFVIALTERRGRAEARISVCGTTELNGTILARFGDLDPIDLPTALQLVREYLQNVYGSIGEAL